MAVDNEALNAFIPGIFQHPNVNHTAHFSQPHRFSVSPSGLQEFSLFSQFQKQLEHTSVSSQLSTGLAHSRCIPTGSRSSMQTTGKHPPCRPCFSIAFSDLHCNNFLNPSTLFGFFFNRLFSSLIAAQDFGALRCAAVLYLSTWPSRIVSQP